MNARSASVFKPILFQSIEADLSVSTPENIKTILDTINEFIGFINAFRYRNTYPDETDVEGRERLVAKLLDTSFQERMQTNIFAHWFCLRTPHDEIEEKKQAFKKIIEAFSQYARFAHLSATELAVVAIATQKLILYMQHSQTDIKDVVIQEKVRIKLNELIEVQQEIYRCMLVHLEAFEKDIVVEEKKEETPENDILILLTRKITFLIGEENANWPMLQPDKSLLMAIPELPFRDADQLPTAKLVFEACKAAQEKAEKWKNAANAVIDTAGAWTGWCLNGAWSVTSTLVTTPFKLANEGVQLTSKAVKGVVKSTLQSRVNPQASITSPAEEKPAPAETWVLVEEASENQSEQVNVLSCDLHQYIEDMKKFVNRGADVFHQGEELKNYKIKIRQAIEILEMEKEKLYCFSFFTRHFIELKTRKVKALTTLLDAHDLEGLKALASAQMEGPDKDIILAGRASRTKALLEEMVGGRVKEFPPSRMVAD